MNIPDVKEAMEILQDPNASERPIAFKCLKDLATLYCENKICEVASEEEIEDILDNAYHNDKLNIDFSEIQKVAKALIEVYKKKKGIGYGMPDIRKVKIEEVRDG